MPSSCAHGSRGPVSSTTAPSPSVSFVPVGRERSSIPRVVTFSPISPAPTRKPRRPSSSCSSEWMRCTWRRLGGAGSRPRQGGSGAGPAFRRGRRPPRRCPRAAEWSPGSPCSRGARPAGSRPLPRAAREGRCAGCSWEERTLTPAPGKAQASPSRVDTGRMSTEVKNGQPDSEEITLTLELTLDEAEALKAWLLKPAADGSAAIDDEYAKSVMVQLGSKLDYIKRARPGPRRAGGSRFRDRRPQRRADRGPGAAHRRHPDPPLSGQTRLRSAKRKHPALLGAHRRLLLRSLDGDRSSPGPLGPGSCGRRLVPSCPRRPDGRLLGGLGGRRRDRARPSGAGRGRASARASPRCSRRWRSSDRRVSACRSPRRSPPRFSAGCTRAAPGRVPVRRLRGA